jgi:hypothetical protein
MEFPDALQQQEDDLDLSPDDEEEEEETRVAIEEDEDPYEYDEELPVVPEYGRDGSTGPNSLDDDLILEGKQHHDGGHGMITAFGVLIFSRDEHCGLLLNTRTMPSALQHSSVPKGVCCRMNESTEELKRRVWFICVDLIYTEFSGVLNICRLMAPERALKGTF